MSNIRILRKYYDVKNGIQQGVDVLQYLVNTNQCEHGAGCLVYHQPKWEWKDVPIVEEQPHE